MKKRIRRPPGAVRMGLKGRMFNSFVGIFADVVQHQPHDPQGRIEVRELLSAFCEAALMLADEMLQDARAGRRTRGAQARANQLAFNCAEVLERRRGRRAARPDVETIKREIAEFWRRLATIEEPATAEPTSTDASDGETEVPIDPDWEPIDHSATEEWIRDHPAAFLTIVEAMMAPHLGVAGVKPSAPRRRNQRHRNEGSQ
jgi:hypothetical protein